MVKPIPRDHKGLCLSDPFTHGRQTNISEEDAHNEVGGGTSSKPRAKCFTGEYKPDIKTNLMSGKIEGGKKKNERSRKNGSKSKIAENE